MQMAAKRKYAYYLRGNQIAIIEEGLGSGLCSLSGYSNQTTCEAAGGTWTENAINSNDDGLYRSPVATVPDGLEIEYAYSPRYSITNTNVTHLTLTDYKSTTTGGYLKVKGGSVNYDTTLDVGDHVVLRNAGQFNGLHKITAIDDASATKDSITFSTKYSGSSSWSTFEETVTLYYSVNSLNDESDVIDVPEYLAKALVYYVKAKLAEDMGEYDAMTYNQEQFRVLISNYKSSRIWGSRIMQSGTHSIL